MTSQIIKTQLELDCAKHLVWFQDMFRLNPIQMGSEKEYDLKPELAKIMEDEYMNCLRRELDLYYQGKLEVSP